MARVTGEGSVTLWETYGGGYLSVLGRARERSLGSRLGSYVSATPVLPKRGSLRAHPLLASVEHGDDTSPLTGTVTPCPWEGLRRTTARTVLTRLPAAFALAPEETGDGGGA